MKIRRRLVSNSSSSSFILAHPKNMKRKEFAKLIGYKKDSPLAELIEDIIDTLWDAKQITPEDYACSSWEEAFEDYPFKELEMIKLALEKEWIIKQGLPDDCSSCGEKALHFLPLNYQSENLLIFQEGR